MPDIAALGVRIYGDGIEPTTAKLDQFRKSAKGAEDAAAGMTVKTRGTSQAVTGMQTPLQQATTALGGMGDRSRSAAGSFHLLTGTMGRLIAQFVFLTGTALSVGAYIRYADAWSDMQSRVGAAVKDMQAAPELMQRMVSIANASYAPLKQTVEIYARNVGILKELGYNANQAADYTESLNHMLVITATKGERAAAVQNALSRAMAIGKLSGDGLETVLASGGRLAEALAKQLGTTVNGLRGMAAQGKITSKVIGQTLLSSLEQVRKEAGDMPATVADGLQRIQTGMTALVGSFDQAFGISGKFALALVKIGDGLQSLSQIDFAGWLENAKSALVYFAEALVILAASQIPSLIVAMRGISLGMGLMQAQFVLGVVAVRAYAAAVWLVNGAMAALGGPIGIVSMAIAGIAVYLWNSHRATVAAAKEMRDFDDALRATADGARLTEAAMSKLTQTEVLASIQRQTEALMALKAAMADSVYSTADAIGSGSGTGAAEVASSLSALIELTNKGVITIAEFKQEVDNLGVAYPEYLLEIQQLIQSISATSDATDGLARSEAILRKLTGTATDADMVLLGLKVTGETTGETLANGLAKAKVAAYEVIPPLEQLRLKYGEAAEAVLRMKEANNDIAKFDAANTLMNAAAAAETYAASLEDSQLNAANLSAVVEAMGQSQSLAMKARGALAIAEAMASATGGAENLDDAARVVYDTLNDAAMKALELSSIAGSINFGGAVASAQALANALGISVGLAAQQAKTGQSPYGGRPGDPMFKPKLGFNLGGGVKDPIIGGVRELTYGDNPGSNTRDKLNLFPGGLGGIGGGVGGGGGGGGGGGAAEVSAIDKVTKALKDEMEVLGLTNTQKRIRAELQAAGVEANTKEGEGIADLVIQLEQLKAKDEFINRISEAFSNAITSARTFAEVIQNLKNAFMKAISDMAAKLISSGFKELLTNALSGIGGGGGAGGGGWLGKIVVALLGGKRAGGGPVVGGTPYLINEQTSNSEVFVPSSNGAVLNTQQAQQAVRSRAGAGRDRYVEIRIVEDTGFVAKVQTVAQGVAVQVTKTGIAGYNKQMPARIKQVSHDFRRVT